MCIRDRDKYDRNGNKLPENSSVNQSKDDGSASLSKAPTKFKSLNLSDKMVFNKIFLRFSDGGMFSYHGGFCTDQDLE